MVRYSDVVADKQNIVDLAVVLFQKCSLVNQDKGFATTGWAHEDPVAAVKLSGQGFLMVIQAFEPAAAPGI